VERYLDRLYWKSKFIKVGETLTPWAITYGSLIICLCDLSQRWDKAGPASKIGDRIVTKSLNEKEGAAL